MYTRIMEISPWTLRSAKLEKEHKRLQESLTSLGNGYMGMRGSFEETYSADSHLGTYIAGVWFPDKTRVGWWKNGYPKYFGKAINALNFSKVKIFVDGQEVDLAKNDVVGFSVELDMQHGVLRRSFTVFGVRFDVCKFLSVAQKELAVIRWEAVSVDGKTHQVRIDSIIDADVKNEDSNYEEKILAGIGQRRFRRPLLHCHPNRRQSLRRGTIYRQRRANLRRQLQSLRRQPNRLAGLQFFRSRSRRHARNL